MILRTQSIGQLLFPGLGGKGGRRVGRYSCHSYSVCLLSRRDSEWMVKAVVRKLYTTHSPGVDWAKQNTGSGEGHP